MIEYFEIQSTFKNKKMLTPFIIFTRALGLYFLFTLPAIAIPIVYMYSAFLAISFGSVTGILFMLLYLLIANVNISFWLKRNLLFVFVPVSVFAGYCLIGFLNAVEELWGFNFFLVFPGIAVIAGWASLFISRKKLREKLDPQESDLPLLLKP